jgi:hypothetical protein
LQPGRCHAASRPAIGARLCQLSSIDAPKTICNAALLECRRP